MTSTPTRAPDSEGWVFVPNGSPESLRGTDLTHGRAVRVAVWLAQEADRVGDDVYRAHVRIEGHPTFGAPTPVHGATPFQASELAFAVIRDYCARTGAYPVDPGHLPAR